MEDNQVENVEENGNGAEEDYTLKASTRLGQAFDRVIEKSYGSHRTPEPIVTPTGIRHLDALLGGGIVSSGPVVLTSTPESGLV